MPAPANPLSGGFVPTTGGGIVSAPAYPSMWIQNTSDSTWQTLGGYNVSYCAGSSASYTSASELMSVDRTGKRYINVPFGS